MLFHRPPETYSYSDQQIEAIRRDSANPLNQTARLLTTGSVVLDVGAGSGLLGRLVKTMAPGVVMDAVEPSQAGAEAGRGNYRRFHVGLVEDHLDEISRQGYDFLVLNDVIEHVVDPVSFLRTLTDAVGPDCRLLVSTPHVGYAGVRLHLLEGRFDYVDSGILERTHLRFFTYPTLMVLFAEAGLTVARTLHLRRRLVETEFAAHASRRNSLARMRISRDPLSATYQFLFLLQHSGAAATTTFEGRTDGLAQIALGR